MGRPKRGKVEAVEHVHAPSVPRLHLELLFLAACELEGYEMPAGIDGNFVIVDRRQFKRLEAATLEALRHAKIKPAKVVG